MGTLTGNSVPLDGHCCHKLPTSCRLSATLDCCACQDLRPHNPTYMTYIDGAGLRNTGTRWQRYCWFCQEFWANRVRVAGLDPRQTRVPNEPDQSSFCEAWHDYRRGYKVVGDSHEVRLPERSWRDTDPGFLPLLEQPNVAQPVQATLQALQGQPHLSLDETLDSLLESADGDTDESRRRRQPPEREDEADTEQADTRPEPPIAERIRAVRELMEEAEGRKRRIASDLAVANRSLRELQQQHNSLMRAQTTARNMERVFGTREDFLREGASYESPLTTMFARADERYRTAEEVRAAERALSSNQALNLGQRRTEAAMGSSWRALLEDGEDVDWPQSLDDGRIQRPEPKSDEQMRVSLACRICLQQLADTATLPCGHLVMCSYCAAVAIPTKDEARTQPLQRHAWCPQCRKQIKRLARIYTA